MVTRTMSSNEAKQNWGQVMAIADEPGTAIVVESHGKPRVAVIPIEDLETFRRLQQAARVDAALRAMRQVEIPKANPIESEIAEIADRASHELYDDLAAEEKLRFERDGK